MRFLSVFATYAHKEAQTLLVSHETVHTTQFGICYCVEVFRIEKLNHMLEIT